MRTPQIRIGPDHKQELVFLLELTPITHGRKDRNYIVTFSRFTGEYSIYKDIKALDNPKSELISPYNMMFQGTLIFKSIDSEPLYQRFFKIVRSEKMQENSARVILFNKKYDTAEFQMLHRTITAYSSKMDVSVFRTKEQLITLLLLNAQGILKEEEGDDTYKIIN